MVLDELNSNWQLCSENKQLPHLNKLHNFPQQTLSHNDSTLSLFPLSPDYFCCIPQAIWPFLALTAMANPSLIHLHAVLTRSPRLWGGTRALVQHGERRRHLHYQRGKANGQPLQPDRIGQARPNKATTGDPLTTAARSLWRETISPEQQHDKNIFINLMLIGCRSWNIWPPHLCGGAKH